MLLIIFLGLIATLTSVSRGCEFRHQDVKNFNFSKVCIIVLTQFLKQASFKTAASVLYFIYIYINNCSRDYIRLTFELLNDLWIIIC